ncbi:hypothetical protein JOL79_17340 [Microbispora sp. RL4-1S]|uniref:Esterase-like activity of phytase family protein n=1 Tax=Microbispora oryzae TaxID=2806554 RepID=A0A940WRC1_9ACTN|nr:hypothetical protein [Microbispora oryzae]MBP2705579.1 hypothetical protein [Microbispora oryzae]
MAGLVAAFLLIVAVPLVPGAARADGDRLLFRFHDKRINESSGMAVSPTHPGIVYTHNDSGDGPRVFAVGSDGRTRATFTIGGAGAWDWEAMAATLDRASGRGVLWLADIGDNQNNRRDISVYRVTEPRTVRDATLPATRYRFRYEDGSRNAEGVMVNPRTGRLYVVSKEIGGSVYEAPARLRTDRVNVLRKVGPAPIMATDAAYAPDGSAFVIRTYFSASVYRAPGDLLAHVTMPPLDQAESITYTRDGSGLMTGSEGADSPVYLVPLPAGARARAAPVVSRPTPRPTPSPGRRAARTGAAEAASESAGGGVPALMTLLWVGVALGVMGVIATIAYRTGR